MSLVAALLGTIVVYFAAERLDVRVRRPWTNPVGLTVLAWVMVVGLTALPLRSYELGTRPLTWALRPAVVALGWLMYRQREALWRLARPLLAGVLSGTVVSLLLTPVLARALGADVVLQRALALKSVTSAVGVDLAGRVGADAALAVPFIIVTGILGAALGPWLLRRVGVRRPETIGVAVGTNSHGIGTAAVAATGHELAVALSGLAMGLAAVATALLAPVAFALLGLG